MLFNPLKLKHILLYKIVALRQYKSDCQVKSRSHLHVCYEKIASVHQDQAKSLDFGEIKLNHLILTQRIVSAPAL
jgi:hypothetical protein